MRGFDRIKLMRTVTDGATALGLKCSESQIVSLIDYLALLSKWNAVYNLTAVRDPEQMVTQHLLDSMSAVPAFAAAKNVLDVGAGGGLPGLVLAILRPDMQVSLIDTVHKKTAFLTQVKAELGLANVTVHTARVEQLQLEKKFDVITSRAFAELADFVNWSAHLLEQGGQYIAMKGVNPQQEMACLPTGWTVKEVRALHVPGMQAERHLIFIERAAG